MTTIIATIKPFYLNEIRSGRKTVEVRKTAPKEWPVRVLLCESGSGGQIKAEFTMKYMPFIGYKWAFLEGVVSAKILAERARLSIEEVLDYAGDRDFLYFWMISDVIDYCSTKGYRVRNISEFGLKRPPQSWQYVKEGE